MLIRVWLAPVVIFEWMLEGCVVISCLLAREQKEAYFMLYLLGITLPVSNQFFAALYSVFESFEDNAARE